MKMIHRGKCQTLAACVKENVLIIGEKIMLYHEAISVIESIRAKTDYCLISDEARSEALDMAISALDFRDRYDQLWEEIKSAGMNGREIEIRHSGRTFRIREVAQ